MSWWQRTESRAGTETVAVALALTAVLVLGEAVAAGHDDCHTGDDGPCAVCLLAKTPSCLPEAVLPALPVPAIQQQSVSLPVSRPYNRPLFAMTARGPPLEAL